MNILDLVESWAKSKGWWTFKTTKSEDGYLYVAKHDPYSRWDVHYRGPIFTLWPNNAWDMNGEYPNDPTQKLEPADPDFFLKLEHLVVTKT
jgi:hypothetical protein